MAKNDYKLLLQAQIDPTTLDAQIKAVSQKSVLMIKAQLNTSDLGKLDGELNKIKEKAKAIGKITFFKKLSSEMKKFVSYSLAGGFGIGAYALILFAPEFVIQAQPYFNTLFAIFSAIFLNNAFHRLDKK